MYFLSRQIVKFSKSNNFINVTKYNINDSIKQSLLHRNYASKPPKSFKSFFKLGLVGISVGALVGTGYSIHQKNKPRTHIANEEIVIPVIDSLPKIAPSRKIRLPSDQSGLKLTLYQYQTCPFCCKVRAFLDYYGISYDVIEVDPVLRQSIKWSTYKKVPILLANVENGYQPLNDSSMIISALASYLQDNDKALCDIVKCYPFISYIDENGDKKSEIMNKYFIMLFSKDIKEAKKEEMSEERKWRKWADDILVHTLSPNVYRTREEALQAFNWFSEVGEWDKHFPAWERYIMVYVGAYAMWLISKRLKKRHNLKDDVRQSLYDDCNNWMKRINEKGSTFMGGNEPDLSDLAVYGILNSIEGCDAFGDVLRNTKINNWYYSMQLSVRNHKGSLFA